MKTTTLSLAAALAVTLAPGPGADEVRAQTFFGVGVGVARPWGDFADTHDGGTTVRGEAGLSLLLVDIYGQAGWSRFPLKDDPEPAGDGLDDASIYHLGAGARAGVGPFWVGVNAAYFFGDADEGIGFIPEVGARILMLEAVADARIDGDQKWWSARVGLRF